MSNPTSSGIIKLTNYPCWMYPAILNTAFPNDMSRFLHHIHKVPCFSFFISYRKFHYKSLQICVFYGNLAMKIVKFVHKTQKFPWKWKQFLHKFSSPDRLLRLSRQNRSWNMWLRLGILDDLDWNEHGNVFSIKVYLIRPFFSSWKLVFRNRANHHKA